MTTKYWQARAYWAELRSAALAEALKGLLDRYVDLVNCGDCGNWNPETEQEVIAARAALAKDDDPEPRFELEE